MHGGQFWPGVRVAVDRSPARAHTKGKAKAKSPTKPTCCAYPAGGPEAVCTLLPLYTINTVCNDEVTVWILLERG